MKLINDFTEYQILDLNDGKKLESWAGVILNRPDPQVIWQKEESNLWKLSNAIYDRSNTGGGKWQIKGDVPNSWVICYHDLKFNLKLMGFKHTGLFPEQAYNWNLIREKIKSRKGNVKVLNLFAYTGAATVAALKEGASVVHVDSSRGMIDWAKEKGFEKMELEVNAENTAAIALYQKFGFQEFGRYPQFVKYEDGSYGDALYMVKELKTSAV